MIAVSASLFKAAQPGITYTATLWSGAVLLAATTVLLSPFQSGSTFLQLLLAYALVNTMTLDLPQRSLSAELSRRATAK